MTNSIANRRLGPNVRRLALALAVSAVAAGIGEATPYASAVTNDHGSIQFILNEGGADVSVVFEDSTTYELGTLGKGALPGQKSYIQASTNLVQWRTIQTNLVDFYSTFKFADQNTSQQKYRFFRRTDQP